MTLNYEYYRNYTINYYLRYYPSRLKLRQKLLDKTGNLEDFVDKLISDLEGNLIKEFDVIENKIAFYISRNKKLSYIKNKLIEKLFKKEDIEKILSEKFNLEKTYLSKELLFKKVENYKLSGKSKKYVFMKLYDRKEDLDLINNILDEVFTEENEKENLLKEFENIDKKLGKQKIIEKLLRKGFSYDNIKKLF